MNWTTYLSMCAPAALAFSLHHIALPYSQRARVCEMDQLTAGGKRSPIVVCGDFNINGRQPGTGYPSQ